MMKPVIDTEFIDAREVATILKVPVSDLRE